MPTLNCTTCGDEYYKRPCKADESKYCSRKCADIGRRKGTPRTCEYCGESYHCRPSREGESRFCSRNCKDSFKRERVEWREEIACSRCGETLLRTPFEVERRSEHFCDDECRGEWLSENRTGPDAPNWQGGVTRVFGSRWPQLREMALRRDEHCQYCDSDGTDTYLDVHHIVPRREFDDVNDANTLENVVVLCRSCHKRAEHGSIACPHPSLPGRSPAKRIENYINVQKWLYQHPLQGENGSGRI